MSEAYDHYMKTGETPWDVFMKPYREIEAKAQRWSEAIDRHLEKVRAASPGYAEIAAKDFDELTEAEIGILLGGGAEV